MLKKIINSLLACLLFFSILSPPFIEKAHAYSSSPLLTILPDKLQTSNVILESHQYTRDGADFRLNGADYINNYIATKAVNRNDPQSSKPYVQLRFPKAVQDANGNLYDLRLRITVEKATTSNMQYFYWYKANNTAEYGQFSYAGYLEVPTANASVWSDTEYAHEAIGTRANSLESSFKIDVLSSSGVRPTGTYSLYFGDIDQSVRFDNGNATRADKEAVWFGDGFSNIQYGSSLSRDSNGWIGPRSRDTIPNVDIGDTHSAATADASTSATFWWKGSSCGTCILSFNNNSYTEITKVDQDTGQKIWTSGGHFQIKDASGRVVAERDIVNGMAAVALPAGRYTIEETSAPSGYERASTPKVVYLTDKYEEVRFGNERLKLKPDTPPLDKVRIKIQKTDDYKGADRTNYPLAGAVFRVENDYINKTFTTDEKGLTPEIEVKKGLALNISEVTAPKGHIRMKERKLIMGDSKIYDGAIIEIFNPIETPKLTPFMLDIRKTLATNGAHEELPQLHAGDVNFTLEKWTLVAGKTPEWIINSSSPVSSVVYTNINSRDVSKIDFSDPAYVISGNPLTENGKVVLDDGIYMLRETKTTPFYSASSSGQFLKNSLVKGFNIFKVENGVISDLTLTNANKQVTNALTPHYGEIVVKKKDTEGNALQGVVFNLYDSETATNALATVRTNADGIARFNGLDLKEYWIEETSTQEGFSLLSKRIKLSSYKAIAYHEADEQESRKLIQNPKTYNDTEAQKYYVPANFLSITNHQSFTLPNTGNPWMMTLLCAALASLITGAFLFLKQAHK